MLAYGGASYNAEPAKDNEDGRQAILGDVDQISSQT
jgi:hypothetical protein